MLNVNILNESSAITMYYGYTKYRDLFLNQEKKIDPTIEKNILFIDIGYSKTSFILSYFKYNIFKVEYVLCDPNIGGRNFDELIYNYCIKEFSKDKDNIEINNKMKYRLIESIKSSRIKLSVNTEINISVESFYKDIDLYIILTRQKYEELIIDYINKFEEYIKNIINKYNYIKEIELSGEIMRTPIFQNIIEKYKLKICKTILIDECTSVGAALLNNFYLKDFPIQHFKYFIHFNYYDIYYIINYGNIDLENILINKGINQEKEIYLNNYSNQNINFQLYYNNKKNIFYKNNLNQLNINGNIIFKVNIHDLFYKIYFENKEINKIDICLKNKEEYINNNIKHINLQKQIDSYYHNCINQKLQLSKTYYFLKNLITKNEELKEMIPDINYLAQLIQKKNFNEQLITQIKTKINILINNCKNKIKNISNELLEQLNINQQN